MTTQPKTEIVQVDEQTSTVLAPLAPAEAKQQMQLYQEYVKALLVDDDYQNIQGKQFKKKSSWRKIALAFNLSIRAVEERREELPNDDFAYHFTCEAISTNGRTVIGTGSCTAYEKANYINGKWMTSQGKPAQINSVHNVRGTAETRAFNRAVSNLVAAGEVSAEEVNVEQGYSATKKQANDVPNCPQCKGSMFDNRTTKTNPKAPDFRCRKKDCVDANGYVTSLWETSVEQKIKEEKQEVYGDPVTEKQIASIKEGLEATGIDFADVIDTIIVSGGMNKRGVTKPEQLYDKEAKKVLMELHHIADQQKEKV